MADIPRTSLERVLARAVELQSMPDEPGESISETRLLEIAREVGIDPQHVRQALAEELTHSLIVEDDTGPLLAPLGSSVASAQRTVPGTPSSLLTAIEAALPNLEMMVPVRRSGDRLILEPRHDKLGNFMRSLGIGGRRFDLVRLDQLAITATRVDDSRSVLRLDAVLSGARRSERATVVAISSVMFLMAASISIPIIVFSLAVPAFAAVTASLLGIVAAGASWLSWRSASKRYRTLLSRVQNRIEFLLDEIQSNRLEQPPSLLDRMLKTGASLQSSLDRLK